MSEAQASESLASRTSLLLCALPDTRLSALAAKPHSTSEGPWGSRWNQRLPLPEAGGSHLAGHRADEVMSVKLWTALSHRFCWATANNDCSSTARPCSNTVSENVNKKWKDLKTLLMGIQPLGCHHVFPSFSFFCSPPTCPEKCKESQRTILLLASVFFFFNSFIFICVKINLPCI